MDDLTYAVEILVNGELSRASAMIKKAQRGYANE